VTLWARNTFGTDVLFETLCTAKGKARLLKCNTATSTVGGVCPETDNFMTVLAIQGA